MSDNLDQLCQATLAGVATLVERREVSPVEITCAMLDRIERLDPRLHSYLTVTADQALAQARAAEDEILRGRYRGPLHGMPVAVKDLCATRGIRTTCASHVLADWVPDYDATVVSRLAAAGAVLLGKLNLTEFAMSGYAPSLPIPVNPWSPDHYPGGSSSGAGVATAAGLCLASIGTDTGGSIRLPSAYCGVVGLKPTYGRVSRHGVFPLADSLDHVGPLARSVADCAIVLDAISGFDPLDPTSLRAPSPECRRSLSQGVAGLRVGLDRKYISRNVQGEVTQSTLDAAAVLAELGAEIVELDLPAVDDELLDAWPPLCAADATVAHEAFYPARAGEYGTLFRTFLEYGTALPAKVYARAHLLRLVFRVRFQDVFSSADVLICPPVPMLPPLIEFVDPYAPFSTAITPLMRFTAPFNFSGNPTLSFPSGFSTEGLPHSVQLVGPHCGEALLCRIGHAYERATPWHERRPPLST
jgi:amidase